MRSHSRANFVTAKQRLFGYSVAVSTISHRTATRLFVCFVLNVALCAFVFADTPAPQFTAKTLDGQTLTNASLSGNVVLLQFWTTWCPVCHQDQAAVDNIQAAFAGNGLVVIAVDDGEPETLVRKYLQSNPRSVPIVANNGRSLAAQFGVHSYPHYVVIDRSGNVVVSRGGGGGGEPYLRSLLNRAGLGARETKTETQQAGARTPSAPNSPQLTNVPVTQNKALAKPIPKTIFVFANGEQLEADHYTMHSNFLHVTAEGQDRSIPISALDVKRTVAVNRERGINVKIPTSGSEVFLAF